MARGAADTQGQIDALREDFAALKEDLMSVVKSAINSGTDGAAGLKDKVSGMLGEHADQVRDMVDNATDKGREALESLEDTVAEKPLMALGAAFGIGLLVGLMMRRG